MRAEDKLCKTREDPPSVCRGWAWRVTDRQEGEDIVQCDRARGMVQGQL